MKLTRTVHFHPALFQALPLVNVLFLVLAVYALTSQFVLQPGVAVALPTSPFLLPPQHRPEIVSVTAAPAAALYFRDRAVTLPELDGLLGGDVRERSLVVRADRRAPYDLVTAVINLGLRRGFSVSIAAAPSRP